MVLEVCREYNLFFLFSFFSSHNYWIWSQGCGELLSQDWCLFMLFSDMCSMAWETRIHWKSNKSMTDRLRGSLLMASKPFPNFFQMSLLDFQTIFNYFSFSCQNNQTQIFLSSSQGPALSLIRRFLGCYESYKGLDFLSSLLGLIWFPLLFLYGMHTGGWLWFVFFLAKM